MLTCSALRERGVDEVWEAVERHRATLEEAGELAERRRRQEVDWMWSMVRERLLARLREDEAVGAFARELEDEVRAGRTPASLAAARILERLGGP